MHDGMRKIGHVLRDDKKIKLRIVSKYQLGAKKNYAAIWYDRTIERMIRRKILITTRATASNAEWEGSSIKVLQSLKKNNCNG